MSGPPNSAAAINPDQDLPGGLGGDIPSPTGKPAYAAPSGGIPMTRRIQAISRWREQYNPLRALTMPRAVRWLEDYNRGWMADLQWANFFIEQTDPDLIAIIERRVSRLLEMDYSGKISEEKAEESLAKEQLQMVKERISKIDNLYEAIEHLAMASFRGYAHCEKWYDDQGELSHLEVVDQWNVVRDGLRGAWKYNPRALQTAFFGLPDELVMPSENFLIREVRRPIDRFALVKFIRSNLSEKDWDAYVEIFGIPGGVLVGPANMPPDKEQEYEAAARNIAEGGTGFAPYGSEWKPNVGPRGSSPFKERLDWLTEKLVLVGTGGLLTMVARSGSGTLGGNAHTETFEQIAKGDARRISELVNRQVVLQWIQEEFPGQPQLAYFEMAANEETKVGEVVQHISTLEAAGYRTDVDQVAEKTGYQVELVQADPAGQVDADADKVGEEGGAGADPNTGDPKSVQNRRRRRRIANTQRRQVDAGAAVFARNAARKLTKAQTDAVQPLLDRIAGLKDLPHDEFASGLMSLRTDLPRMFAEARLQVPDIANVWEDILGTALVDGFADLPTQAA